MADAIKTPKIMKSTTITHTINSRISFMPRPITIPKHTEIKGDNRSEKTVSNLR